MKCQELMRAVVVGVALMSALIITPAVASAEGDEVSVEVRAISASRDGDHVDSALSDIQGTLNVTFAGYTSFTQLSTHRVSLSEGSAKQIELPNGKELTLTYNGHAGKLVKLGLGIAGKMSTTLRVSSGSTFFQAGMRYKGGILILAIKVD